MKQNDLYDLCLTLRGVKFDKLFRLPACCFLLVLKIYLEGPNPTIKDIFDILIISAASTQCRKGT